MGGGGGGGGIAVAPENLSSVGMMSHTSEGYTNAHAKSPAELSVSTGALKVGCLNCHTPSATPMAARPAV